MALITLGLSRQASATPSFASVDDHRVVKGVRREEVEANAQAPLPSTAARRGQGVVEEVLAIRRVRR